MTPNIDRLIERAEQLIARIESVLPQPLSAPDWSASIAWRYRKRSSGHGTLEPVKHVATIALDQPEKRNAMSPQLNRRMMEKRD